MSTVIFSQLPEWLKESSGDEIQLVKNRAEQLAERAYDAVDRIIEVAKEIGRIGTQQHPSQERAEAEIATKFGLRVVSLGEKIRKPDPATYENLRLFLDSLNEFYRDLMRAGSVWIRKLDRGYKDPVRRMQLQLNELRNSARVLDEHLQQKYVDVRKFEAMVRESESAKSTANEMELTKEELRLSNSEADRTRAELGALKSDRDKLETSEKMREYNDLESQVENIRNNIKRILDPLEKPFDKFLRLPDRDRTGLEPGTLDTVSEYLHDPIDALCREQPTFSRLRSTMGALQAALESNRLGLKDARVRAALKIISSIKTEDNLPLLRDQYLQACMRRDHVLNSDDMKSLLSERTQIDEKTESVKSELTRIERSIRESNARLEELTKRLDDQKQRIEKGIKGLTGQTVRISS